jgi:hypothetical protein
MTKRRRWTPTKLARPSRLFPVLVLVLCYAAPIQLGSQSKQIGPAQESAAGSRARPPADSQAWLPSRLGEPMLRNPVWVYNNWSSYDELSDNIPLTEALAMKELDEIARLRKLGIHFDYSMMDAFWFAPDGGYLEWRTPNWPNGPDRWIARCKANGLLPGMWFGTNELVKINAAPQWRDSLTAKGGSMAFYEVGFLPDFMNVLQFWYDRGIRMFKFDFVDFGAATPAAEKTQTPTEIHAKNETAFREALKKFRTKNPEVMLVAFNGFGGDVESTAGPFPFHHPVDLRWLEVYGVKAPADDPDTLTADPRLIDAGQGGMGRHTLSGYRLQPKSPAKGSGKLIGNNGGHDFLGNAVPSCNRTDRGAWQSDECSSTGHEPQK